MKTSMRVRSVPIVATLAIAGASFFGLTAQAWAEVVANVRFPFSGTTTNSCFPGGGEQVAVEGVAHIVYRQQNRDEPVDTTLNFERFEGVGLTSGDRYTVTGTSAIHHNITEGATSENSVQTLGLISRGSDENLQFKGYFHVTYNAQGEVTSYRFEGDPSCVG
jgi:hypothetical protein